MKFCVLALCLLSIWAIPVKTKNARITSGAKARAGQFPFIAAVYKTTPTGNFFCGGALYESQWIITAAQCCDGATSFVLHLGANNLTTEEPNRVILATETYFVYPDYNALTLENDLCLIKLREWIRTSDYVKNINYLSTTRLPDSSMVATMGWGQLSDTSPGPVEELRYLFIPTISNDECRLTYGNAITESMVCIAGNLNQGTCLGDAGGPLIQYTASDQTYLSGVSSFYSGYGCDFPYPSGFMRIDTYVDWLTNTSRNN